jgi:hypothetical protein
MKKIIKLIRKRKAVKLKKLDNPFLIW